MADRSRDWLAQAEKDLEVAATLRRSGNHEWACFAAQHSRGALQSEEAIEYAGQIVRFAHSQMAATR